MEHLTVSNWDKWQSYRKDRGQPPWIKIHRCVMRCPEWVMLNDAERGQLVAIWLLAADHNGVIPASDRLIKKLCHMETLPPVKYFIELGFLYGDVTETSERRQHDQPDKIREEERREEESIKTLMSSQQVENNPPASKVPYKKIIDLYHQILPNHPKVRVITQARKSSIRQRHIHDMDSDLKEWESYFGFVGRSEFLTGKASPVNGRRVFIADLEFICKQGNFAKIFEGKYHG